MNDVKISDLDNPATNFNLKSIDISKLLKAPNGLDVVNLVFIFIGLYFFANLVMAGWAFMMSSGDVKKATAASSNITNAFSGLIMAFTAFLIVKLILTALGISDSLQLQ